MQLTRWHDRASVSFGVSFVDLDLGIHIPLVGKIATIGRHFEIFRPFFKS